MLPGRRAEEEADGDAGRVYEWDDLKTHVAAFLDGVDAKRQVITDQQVLEAVATDLLTDIAKRLKGQD